MSLAEPDILRYSRQILLSGVGGRGQEQLLRQKIVGSGEGPAVGVALAYLAAGGCSVQVPPRPLRSNEAGFLGAPTDDMNQGLRRLNARASAPCDSLAQVEELPARFSVSGPWIALGSNADESVVLYRASAGCVACFNAMATRYGRPIESRAALLGSLAALAMQKLVLGSQFLAGGIFVSQEAAILHQELKLCPHCR